jgi:hypothetical protein
LHCRRDTEKNKKFEPQRRKGRKEKTLGALCVFAVQKSFNAVSLLKR